MPFDIPATWEWTRLRNVFYVWSSSRVRKSDWKSEGIPFYRAREIVKLALHGKVNNELYISLDLFNEKAKNGLPHAGDIMVTAVGTIGTAYVVQKYDRFYFKDASVICLGNASGVNSQLYCSMFSSAFMQVQMHDKTEGTTVDTITIEKAENYLLPVPPLHEQHRIAQKVEEILSRIEEYKKAHERYTSILSKSPGNLRERLIQAAIQGKLVSQDESDEPASVLLERIAKERAAKLGKKAAKSMSRIERRGRETYYEVFSDGSERDISDEVPFEIPKSWTWCRLQDLLYFCSTGPFGSMVHKTDYVDTIDGVPLVNPTNIKVGHIDELGIQRVSNGTKERLARYLLREGFIILARRGDLSKCAIIGRKEDGWLCGTGSFFLKTVGVGNDYFQIMYTSLYVQNYLSSDSIGTTMKNLNQSMLKKLLVPLPPKKEQIRICDKYVHLMRLLHL